MLYYQKSTLSQDGKFMVIKQTTNKLNNLVIHI